ncbi:MMPL family transporter [Nocardia sp. NPDC058058]|uniref:MMPL family transporter n=1 Tax=Nocardia sp. NPDC058058 TaxID=3346317 RepID=UPI0036DD46E3
MFTRWGDLVYKLRYTVLGITVAGFLALGGFGLGLESHLSSSGWFDPNSQSVAAAQLKDSTQGRDHNADILLLFTAPEGKTIDDPDFSKTVVDKLNSLPKEYPEISKINGAYWRTETGEYVPNLTGTKDKKYAFAAVSLAGNNDNDMLRNYAAVQNAFKIPGVTVEVAGLQPIAYTLNNTIASDVKRMELLALPAVAVLLFFIFGGVVAAALPLIIGGLTIIASNGIIMALTKFTEVNSFVSAVVSMIGLGLAIDYGLFIVSRFREELAEGYDTKAAVRRSVMTAGRTVTSSATMIIAASAGMLLFPQGFLKSVAYGTIAAVLLAMVSALTVLPAMLSILGPRVDMLGLKWIRKTKTAEEVENGFWGKSTAWVMKHPLKVAIPLTIGLLLLIIPVKNLQFGGISETYLPPDNVTRLAQEHFDEHFPLRKSDPVQLVIITDNSKNIGPILTMANKAPGLVKNSVFGVPAKPPNGSNVWSSEATVVDSAHPEDTVNYLRAMEVPDGVQVMVTGQPVMMMDSINSLLDLMPLMIGLVLLITTVLMFLTFGSLVLPLKAALMSALGLGSTLGILTWIFIDGHGASLLNFTPQPIMSPVLVLIIAIIYGLSVDYEVFLLSRMVEARTQGASTTEAVRMGTAQTGRIITAAALILLVVTGAFAFSELVMMQYIAYGMVAALFIDATFLRMLLVPATMKLLGDDCWWAPAWMKKIQQKIGLGEPILDDERPGGGEVVDLVKTTPITDPVTMQIPALTDSAALRLRKPRPARKIEIDSEAPTQRISKSMLNKPVVDVTPKPGTASAPPNPETSFPAPQSAPIPGNLPAPGAGSGGSLTNLGGTAQTGPGTTDPGTAANSGAAVGNPGAASGNTGAPSGTPGPATNNPGPAAGNRGVGSGESGAGFRAPLQEPPTTDFSAAKPETGTESGGPAERPSNGVPAQADNGTHGGFAAPDFSPVAGTGVTPRNLGSGAMPPGSTTPAGSDDSTRAASGTPPKPDAPQNGWSTPGAVAPSAAPGPAAQGGRAQGPAVQPPIPSVSAPAAPPAPPAPTPAAPQSDSPSDAPHPVGAERVLPPPPASKLPPHPATRAQLYQPHEAEELLESESAETQPHPTHHAAEEQPQQGPGRSSIEQWMSDLRSARKRPGKAEPEDDDEGKHRGGDGRTVSVNELLRRQNRD